MKAWGIAKVSEGMHRGELAAGDSLQVARLLFEATLAFHHPRLVAESLEQSREAALLSLLAVLFRGLGA